jgi:hypothetical protein
MIADPGTYAGVEVRENCGSNVGWWVCIVCNPFLEPPEVAEHDGPGCLLAWHCTPHNAVECPV